MDKKMLNGMNCDVSVKEGLSKLIDEINQGGGGGGSTVVANPTLAGTEADLTGIEIDGVKFKVPDESGSEVVANPTLAGTEADLTGIEIDGVKFKVSDESGSEVVANPTLAGTEADLTGIEIDGVKFKVPSGGGSSQNLYKHTIMLYKSSNPIVCIYCNILSTSNTAFTRDTFLSTLQLNKINICTGYYRDTANNKYANLMSFKISTSSYITSVVTLTSLVLSDGSVENPEIGFVNFTVIQDANIEQVS